jgi:hypothetical protein
MKIQKKLTLASQTVRVLSSDALRGVGGGMSADPIRCNKSVLANCRALPPLHVVVVRSLERDA